MGGTEMIEFILTEANRPFAIAIAAMLTITLLEVILALGGLGLMAALDNLVPEDFDLDVGDVDIDAGMDLAADADIDVDADIDAGGGANFLHMVLGFFGIGRVPLLVVIVSFLACFGLAGYFTQAAVHGLTGFYLPAVLASAPAFVGGSFVTRRIAMLLGRLVPEVETEAVDSGSFVGRTAVITLGEARHGAPTQGRLKDPNGQAHYVMIEPDRANASFRQGDEVLLIGRRGGVFRAIEVTSDALSRG
jgi:hypothetical protein